MRPQDQVPAALEFHACAKAARARMAGMASIVSSVPLVPLERVGRAFSVVQLPGIAPWAERETSEWLMAAEWGASAYRLLLAENRHARRKTISVADIIKAMCQATGLRRNELMSHRRHKMITWPRQFGIHWAREVTPLSFPNIGRRFGGFDHTTVVHACAITQERLARGDIPREWIEAKEAVMSERPCQSPRLGAL